MAEPPPPQPALLSQPSRSALLAIPPSAQNTSRRTSRFTEHTTQEYTPTQSVYEEDDIDESEYERDEEATPRRRDARRLSTERMLVRAVAAAVHLALCAVLTAILGLFLAVGGADYARRPVRPQAVTLLVLLALDILLDLGALARCRMPWPSWALLLRLVAAVGYLAVFMVYIAFGRAFTPGYMYWGMQPGYASPVLYLLIWLTGIWNLIHITVHRHTLGNGVLQLVTATGARSMHHTTPPRPHATSRSEPSTRRSSHSGSSPRRLWGRRWHRRANDTDSRPDSGPSTYAESISLHERRGDDEDKTMQFTTTTTTAWSRDKAEEAGETALGPTTMPAPPPIARLQS